MYCVCERVSVYVRERESVCVLNRESVHMSFICHNYTEYNSPVKCVLCI